MDLTVTDPMRCCQCTCGDMGNSVDGALLQSADSGSVGTSPCINLTLTATSSANTGAAKRTEKRRPPINSVCLPDMVMPLLRLFPCPGLMSRARVLGHDDLPDHVIRQFHFPARHGRFPGMPLYR